MGKAKIYCEVTCSHCGNLAYMSGYYNNSKTISKLKASVNDWIWDKENCGNLCPDCQKELNKTAG